MADSHVSVGVTAIAREILIECKWKHELALAALSKRIASDKTLMREAIDYAVANILREVTSQQRVKFHHLATVGVDDTRGLAAIAKEAFFDTYQLLNNVKLGDAHKSDLEAYASRHVAVAKGSNQKVRFMRAILKSPKFKDGKRVRECFTELELVRLDRSV